MLDTNIISYLEKNSPYYTQVSNKLSSLKDEDKLCISILSLYEIVYGFHNSLAKENTNTIDFIKEHIEIVPLDLKEVDIFASLKSNYKQQTGIDKNSIKKHNVDFLIASSAIAENAILVSNDKIFESIAKIDPSLRCENWAS